MYFFGVLWPGSHLWEREQEVGGLLKMKEGDALHEKYLLHILIIVNWK